MILCASYKSHPNSVNTSQKLFKLKGYSIWDPEGAEWKKHGLGVPGKKYAGWGSSQKKICVGVVG